MVLARVHRYYSRNSRRLWVAVFFIWLTVLCYQSFSRDLFHALVRLYPAVLRGGLADRVSARNFFPGITRSGRWSLPAKSRSGMMVGM